MFGHQAKEGVELAESSSSEIISHIGQHIGHIAAQGGEVTTCSREAVSSALGGSFHIRSKELMALRSGHARTSTRAFGANRVVVGTHSSQTAASIAAVQIKSNTHGWVSLSIDIAARDNAAFMARNDG